MIRWLAGNLALGVAEGAVTGAKAARYTEVAANLTYTCWQMYARMPTGGRPASPPHQALSEFPRNMQQVEDCVKPYYPPTEAFVASSAGAGCTGMCGQVGY